MVSPAAGSCPSERTGNSLPGFGVSDGLLGVGGGANPVWRGTGLGSAPSFREWFDVNQAAPTRHTASSTTIRSVIVGRRCVLIVVMLDETPATAPSSAAARRDGAGA